MEIVIGLALLLLVIYVAYKLGKFVIKVVLGLVVIALIAGLAWHWFGGSKEDAWNISRMKDQAEEYFQKLTASPAGKELAQTLRDFSAEARKISREKFAEFRDKQLPAIMEKALKYKEELDRQGKLKEAKEFWERFTKWLEDPVQEPPPAR
jgi:hypothetical protein